ncbi:MAG: 50S ribosomal protein L22 [Nitrospinota bacterium]
MEARAIFRYTRLSPQKARIVADLIRGKSVEEALNILGFLNKKAALILKQVLKSAVANAEEKEVDDVDSMVISSLAVDGGPIIKRQLPRARGRATPLLKRTSHITLVLSEYKTN